MARKLWTSDPEMLESDSATIILKAQKASLLLIDYLSNKNSCLCNFESLLEGAFSELSFLRVLSKFKNSKSDTHDDELQISLSRFDSLFTGPKSELEELKENVFRLVFDVKFTTVY